MEKLYLLGLAILLHNSYIAAQGCSNLVADIEFLVDTSGSVGMSNFRKVRDFMKAFVGSFDIGPSAVQVGAAAFSTSVHNVFWLNEFSSKPEVVNAIATMPYASGGTHTEKALEFAKTSAFTTVHGDRPNARNIIIVVTDGRSQNHDQTLTIAKEIRETTPWVVFSVGVGRGVSDTELREIASASSNVFKVENFDALSNLHESLMHSACSVIPVHQHGTSTQGIGGSTWLTAPPVSLGACQDKLPNCGYFQDTCNKVQMLTWVTEYCPRYCGLCK